MGKLSPHFGGIFVIREPRLSGKNPHPKQPGMKNSTIDYTTGRWKRDGFMGRGALVVVAVGIAGFAAYAWFARQDPAAANPLTTLAQAVVPSASAAAEPRPAARTDGPPETAPTAPANSSRPPAPDAPPTAEAQSTPSGPRTAPAGMVFLTKRVTVTRDTGLTSFPEGTLILVKSRAGGTIRGVVRGIPVEVPAAQTATTYEE